VTISLQSGRQRYQNANLQFERGEFREGSLAPGAPDGATSSRFGHRPCLFPGKPLQTPGNIGFSADFGA
jgi:hypothetical protein